MQGKTSDIKIAQELRRLFVVAYNDDEAFNLFMQQFEKDYADKLIHKLGKEKSININKFYKKLKERIVYIREDRLKTIFVQICKVEGARRWVNDNGKYGQLAFEVFYDLYKEDVELLKLINQ
jgi:hypothetical protein